MTELEKVIQCEFIQAVCNLWPEESALQGLMVLPVSYASSWRNFSCIYNTHAVLFPLYPQRITLYPLIYTVGFF